MIVLICNSNANRPIEEISAIASKKQHHMDTISKEVIALNGKDKIQIHGLKIGELAIKNSALTSRSPGTLSTLRSFFDKEFGEWLPVWVWVIVHPEGNFLIDTGLSSEVKKDGYFKRLDLVSKYYFEKQMKFRISREEELDYQLKKVGLETKMISKVVLTHLHIDHTGGMKHLADTPILVNEKEWQTKDGAFPKLFPANSNIQTIALHGQHEFLGTCHYLANSKDLLMIQTPGHTRGHASIALIANEKRLYLFAGDVAYSSKRLINRQFSATIKSHKENTESCDRILALAKKRRIVFLPTHDAEVVQRLKNDAEISA